MEITEYLKSDKQDIMRSYLKNCQWSSAKFLYDLIIDNKVDEVLGQGSRIIFLMDDENVVSFLTLTKKDCIDDESLCPWIGFVYTELSYRGHRYSERLIKYALQKAKDEGYTNVYLATDHIGFYEKYGFSYMENRIDVWNEESRIYYISVR